MADVFISYSKSHRSETEQLAERLEAAGFDVWWDSDLISGDNFTEVILRELEKARAVIVIWSASSVKSDWVRSEAKRARSRGVLIPVQTETLSVNDIPPPFDALQTTLVTDWSAIATALSRLGVQPTQRPALNPAVHAAIADVKLVPSNSANQKHLVVLVHGINTRALWMSEVKPALEQAGYSVALTSYGMYGIFRFLSPFRWQRKRAIERVVKDVRTAIRVRKQATGTDPQLLSVIAHSFGTYVIGRILTDHPEFEWHRIIFCGSVVRDDFPFDQVLDRFTSPLLNEVGTRDYWPAVAESVGWGYGSVGSNGFNRPPVETRWHHGFRHSDFLTKEFCNKFWVPFLDRGKIVAADKAADLPGVIRAITALPVRWIVPLAVCALMISVIYTYRGNLDFFYGNRAQSAVVRAEPDSKSFVPTRPKCSGDLSFDEFFKCD